MFYRFAIVRYWENSVSAEEECLRRIKIAAENLGYVCDVIDTQYRLISDRTQKVSSNTHDFVLQGHFCSGKAENVFSFGALWNPVDFYHKWGYYKSSATLMTNDDFLWSGSAGPYEHVSRLIGGGRYHLKPELMFYPAPPCVLELPVRRSNFRLFYCGINWERLTGQSGRHSRLLKVLDHEDLIDIYGPKRFQGITPWRGFSCYRGEIPFDGVSLIEKISKAGVCLVLSSQSHIKDGIVTNRLFEGLAAGAVIIADQNPSIKEMMGDSCLYFDTNNDNCIEQLKDHLNWINRNPEQALLLAEKAQRIYAEKFCSEVCLKNLYSNLDLRKKAIREHRQPTCHWHLNVIYLLDDSGKGFTENLNILKRSLSANAEENITNYVISIRNVEKVFDADSQKCILITKDCAQGDYGAMIRNVLSMLDCSEYVSIVLPGEELYDQHFSSIIRKMHENNSNLGCSDLIIKMETPSMISFHGCKTQSYVKRYACSGSFVFRKNCLSVDALTALTSLRRGFGLFLFSLSYPIAFSRGFSCKIHYSLPILQEDLDSMSDLRLKDVLRSSVTDSEEQLLNAISTQVSQSAIVIYKISKYLEFLRRCPQLWKLGKKLVSKLIK